MMIKEIDLIIAHCTTLEKIDKLKLDIIYSDDSRRSGYETMLEEQQIALDKLEEELLVINDRSATIMKRKALQNVLNILLVSLKPNDNGDPVSRNQGMILHNYIYSKVSNDLSWTFNGNYGIWPVPDFYYRVGGSFDSQPLIDLLSKKQEELMTFDKINYLSLKAFHETMLEEIRQMSLADKGYEE